MQPHTPRGAGRAAALLLLPALMMAAAAVQSASVTVPYLEGLRPIAPDQVTTLGPDLFGDKVNLFNGALGFEQTDTSLPGNSALPVAITRKHDAGREEFLRGAFGDWDIAVPSIGGVFQSVDGWVTNTGSQQRCSSYSSPPVYYGYRPGHGGDPFPYRGGEPGKAAPASPQTASRTLTPGTAAPRYMPDQIVSYHPYDYWHGTHLTVPGAGSQEVLKRAADYDARPTGGFWTLNRPGQVALSPTWTLVTHQQWQISCLNSIQNGPGEGFVARSPDGVEYRFDWMIRRGRDGLLKDQTSLERHEVQLVATRVSDRFGNWVEYRYDPAAPERLLSIEANDGRLITLRYAAGRVDEVFDGTRRFLYRYDTAGRLKHVIQPDGSRWTFDIGGLRHPYMPEVGEFARCNFAGYAPDATMTGRMTHPSGAEGEFVTRFRYHGRTDVLKACIYMPYGTTELHTTGSVFPRMTISQTLERKTLRGAGLPSMTWSYGFPSTPSSWRDCGTCTNHVKHVHVTDPNGHVTRYTYGVRWRETEGQLLAQEDGWTTAGALRRTENHYRPVTAASPYKKKFGESTNWHMHSDRLASQNIPVERRTITQQGETFVWQVDHDDPSAGDGFDPSVRPLRLKRFRGSEATKAIREAITYADNTALWVLGQTQSVTDKSGATDREIEKTEFSETTALPKSETSFGHIVRKFDFHANGMLRWVENEGGHRTRFDDWKRGSPQKITYADGAIEEQELDNLGKPRWIKNATGPKHHYRYDSMGRVSQVDYPTGDAVAYHPTTLRYTQSVSEERGLGAGHWRQVSETGNAKVTRYFDGFWRERLRIAEDITDPDNTLSLVETRYDHAGRKTFVSYPQRPTGGTYNVDNANQGTHSSFDALGRPTLQYTTSRLEHFRTTTEYLPGFKRKVTNPRGFATTTSFQAFDQPSEEHIARIEAPEGVTVEIDRDRFHKARWIKRSGLHGGQLQELTRRYVYDERERLCKSIEPETGATIQDYDAAGNVAWKATGLALENASACDRDDAPAGRKVSFDHDPRGRLLSTAYGDNSRRVDRTYTADGLLETITSSGVGHPAIVWTYDYNNRRLLENENYDWGFAGGTWNFGRQYDAHGNLSAQGDPWGWLAHAPNALGQPTRVAGFATDIRHHANGMVQGYRAGNGMVHTVTQNPRGLPERWEYGTAVKDTYFYDENGNVTRISDGTSAAAHRTMSDYDGLDRLRRADGPWGAGHFHYDALDNLVGSTVGSRSLTFGFDAFNRLASVSGSRSFTIEYDDDPATGRGNGNVSKRDGQAFVFDLGNRLLQAVGKASYVYDGHGRRSRMLPPAPPTPPAPPAPSALYAYTQDGKMRMHWTSATNITTRYVYLGDKLIAEQVSGGRVTYVHTDALGSPVARSVIASSSATVVARTRYEPYGAAMTAPGLTTPNGIGFTGHVNDPDTGLVYMQQRYYDPIAGRFLSVDPVLADWNAGKNFNRYTYALNNPFRFIDPDGRDSVQAMIDSGADRCGPVSCAGWAVLSAVWQVLGAEGISQLADSGWSSTSAGARSSAAWEVAAVLPFARATRAGIGLAGHAQKTLRAGNPSGHAFRSLREGTLMLRSGNYQRVHLNQTLGTATDGNIRSSLRPDVAGVRNDGKFDIVEVLSPGQNPAALSAKYSAALGPLMGEIRFSTPTKVICTGSRIMKTSC